MKTCISEDMRYYNHLLGEIEAAYHEAAWKLGVSDSVLKILYAICTSGDRCLLSEIGKQTGLSKQTINSAIRNLEKQGLVFLESVTGRTKQVCLTPKGQEIADQTASRVIEIENEVFASLPEQERELFLSLTEKLLQSLKEKVSAL